MLLVLWVLYRAVGILLIVAKVRSTTAQDASDVWIPVVVCFILIVPAVMGMVESVKQGDVPGVMNGTTLSIQGMSEQIVPWMRGYHLHDPLGHPLIRTLLFTSMSLLILVSKTISKSLLGASISCGWWLLTRPIRNTISHWFCYH